MVKKKKKTISGRELLEKEDWGALSAAEKVERIVYRWLRSKKMSLSNATKRLQFEERDKEGKKKQDGKSLITL